MQFGDVRRSTPGLFENARAVALRRNVTRLVHEDLGVTEEEVLVMVALVIILVVLAVAGLIAAGRSFKIVQQYEQGIIFRFGRVLPGTRGPGLTIIRPVGDLWVPKTYATRRYS